MKKVILLATLIFSVAVFSQVGINTTDPNAQLDIRSSNQATPSNTDGIIIPKIDAFPAVSPTALQQGMLVYLTTVSGANLPGFYYWDTAWVKLSTPKSSWDLLGNAGTDPAVNFIGTTDAKDVVFKRDGVTAGNLGLVSTSFGVNSLNLASTGVFNTAFGNSALRSNTTGGYNIAIGNTALYLNDTGSQNVAAGFSALRSNTSGSNNVANGHEALYSNTTGIQNIATGTKALRANTVSNNIATGFEALLTNNTGTQNIATGTTALRANTTGSNNIATGYEALLTNTTGIQNIAIGTKALRANTSGSNNIATGFEALLTNTTGARNIAIGTSALRANTGSNNVATGYEALKVNTSGVQNVAIGNSSLSLNTTGSYNTANGDNALAKNVGGGNNTAIGFFALTNATTGSDNTAVGNQSGSSITTGVNNVALGSNTLSFNTIGNRNTAVGYNAGSTITTGTNNITLGASANVPSATTSDQMSIGNVIYGATMGTMALGKIGVGVQVPTEKLEVAGKTKTTDLQITTGAAANSLLVSDAFGNGTWQTVNTALNNFAWSTTGNIGTNSATNFIGTTDNVDLVFKRFGVISGKIELTNTSFGVNAGSVITTGVNNTAIGKEAYTITNYNNSTALGYATSITADNQVRIGNSDILTIGGFQDWTNVSDKRFKKEIKSNVPGLDFIKKLKPVTYYMDMDAIATTLKTPNKLRNKKAEQEKASMLQTGFLAQDVEKAAKELNYEFSGVDKPKNENDYYGLRYAQFVVPLVKAVQEQQEIIVQEQEKNKQLQATVKSLEDRLKAIEEKLNK